jgi:hypothetical protein
MIAKGPRYVCPLTGAVVEAGFAAGVPMLAMLPFFAHPGLKQRRTVI